MKNLRFNTYYYNTLNDLYYIVRSKSPETVLFCREPFKGEEVESEMNVSQIASLLLSGAMEEAIF